MNFRRWIWPAGFLFGIFIIGFCTLGLNLEVTQGCGHKLPLWHDLQLPYVTPTHCCRRMSMVSDGIMIQSAIRAYMIDYGERPSSLKNLRDTKNLMGNFNNLDRTYKLITEKNRTIVAITSVLSNETIEVNSGHRWIVRKNGVVVWPINAL